MANANAQGISEKRAHRRLAVRLPLAYRRTGSPRTTGSIMSTVNVSTGGVYFETSDEQMQAGESLALEFTVPAADERFPLESRIKTVGRVVRTEVLDADANGDEVPTFTRVGIAVQFEEGLKLVI